MTKEEKIHQQRMNNLVDLAHRSPKERAAICSKGGKKAAQNRQRNKTLKEATEWALALPAIKGSPTVDAIRKQFPGLTNQDALVISVMAEGILKGNVKTLATFADILGENNAKKVDVSMNNFKIEIEEVE